ncbi:MAG: SGNH/GDSL hydrolase family protein [Bacteroidota bacterium]
MRLFLPSLFAAVFLQTSLFAQAELLRDSSVKRVVFIGNSITWSGEYINYIDTYCSFYKPGQAMEFINVGLPSETVSGLSEEGHAGGKFPRPDLHERLVRVLEATKPDLIISCYGMNDGIYLPFDEERFAKYKAGILWLDEEVKKRGIKIIHTTPPIYDPQKGEAYANVLDIYSDWLISRRYTEGWHVIDLHWPMRKYLEDQRQLDSTFYLAKDGVHPNETGHWLMAKEILLYMGYEEVDTAKNVWEALSAFEQAEAVLSLVSERQKISRDAYLRLSKHLRPGLPEGLAIEAAELKMKALDEQIEALLD